MPIKIVFLKKILNPSLKILIIIFSLSLFPQSNPTNSISQDIFSKGKQIRILVDDGSLLAVLDNRLINLKQQEIEPQIIKEFNTNQRIIISQDGNFIGVLNRVHDLAYTFELRKRDDIDNVVFNIEDIKYRTFFLAPEGKFVVGVKVMDGFPTPSTQRTYTFYSSGGEKKATVGPFITKSVAFSPDGLALALNTRDQGLIAFNKSGTKLWEIPGHFSHFKVSTGAVIAAVTSGKKPFILSLYKNGTAPKYIQLQKKCLGLTLSDNGKHASFSDKDSLNYVSINEGKIIWRRPFESGEKAIATVTLSNQGPIAFSTEIKVPRQGNVPAHFGSDKIFLYSATGTKAWQKSAFYSYYDSRPPLLKFSPGETLSLYVYTPDNNYTVDCNKYLKVKK